MIQRLAANFGDTFIPMGCKKDYISNIFDKKLIREEIYLSRIRFVRIVVIV